MDSSTMKLQLQQSYDRQARERDQFSKDDWKVAERALFLSTLREHHLNRLLELGEAPDRTVCSSRKTAWLSPLWICRVR